MSKTIKLALFLAIIAALATGILATVNQITAPIIEQNAAGANTAALKELYPDVKAFTEVEFSDESNMVKQAYKADDSAYVFIVESGKGYADKLGFIIGFDVDGSNSKFKMTFNNETKGFGARLMDEPEYTEAMTGMSTADSIYMLSGATVSSTTMKTAIEHTIKVFNSLSGNNAKPADTKVEESVKILSKIAVDDKTEYLVENKGFAGVNEFKVLIGADGSIVSVENTKFNDTEEIGDQAITKTYLAKFVGMTKETFKAELVSGATYTSQSLVDLLKYVLENHVVSDSKASSQEAIVSKEASGNHLVYLVKVKSFSGENTFEITLDGESKRVVSVKAVSMNDTEEIGNAMVGDANYLAKYTDLPYDSVTTVDNVSGATVTTDSLKSALKIAIEDSLK